MTDSAQYPPIDRLIPQRAPILMVDRLLEAQDDTARTCLTIRPDNFFLDEDGCLDETGLIEHIAQSASALAGYKALRAGASRPPVGYIGEVKRFRLLRRPQRGETVITAISFGAETGGITLLTGETRVGDETVATTQMKISIA